MDLIHKYLFGFLLSSCLLLSKSMAFDDFLVKKIQIDGLKSISKDVILAEINFSTGNKLTAKKSNDIIKSLYKTKFFEQISLDKVGDTLIIKVIERPFIAKINIVGVKNKDQIIKILKLAKISEGLVYDPNSVDLISKQIESHYLSQGHYGIHVDTKVINRSRNRIDLNLHVTEGQESKIADIVFNGNTKFKNSILLERLSHSKSNFLSWLTKSDLYFKERLNEDLENLKNFYLDHGYINFQVDSTQVSVTADKRKVYLTINLTEGSCYRLGKINLSGDFIIPKEQILNIINNKLTEEVFSLKPLLIVKKEIEENLANLGYLKAEAQLNHKILEDDKVIDIDFMIIPNKRYTLRKIMITGNNLTEDFVIRRMLPQLEGTWVSHKDLQEGKEQILRYGYAGKVDLISHPVVENDDQIDIEYKIEEKRNMQLSAGVNYSGSEGLGYEISADIKNFIGTGRDVGITFNKTKVRTAYKFNYFNPYYSIDGIGFGYGVFYQRNHLRKNSKVTDYVTDSLGGDLNWSFPIAKYSSTFVSIGYSKTNLHPPGLLLCPNEITQFIAAKGKLYKEYNLTLGWRYNSLNRYIFPTKGFSHTISFRYNLPFSNLKYYQVHYESNFYKPLIKGLIFNFSSDLGYGRGIGKDPYPFFKNYFVGGADSLRGFEENSLGPLDSMQNPIGGNLLINFKGAIILPLPFKPELESVVRPSIFMDFGQVYNTIKRPPNQPNQSLRYSFGMSVAINTPLGTPIVLSLAKPLNPKAGDERKTFSLTFSVNY